MGCKPKIFLIFFILITLITVAFANVPTAEASVSPSQSLNSSWITDAANGFAPPSASVALNSDANAIWIDNGETAEQWIEFSVAPDEGLIAFDLTSITLGKYQSNWNMTFTIVGTRADNSTTAPVTLSWPDDGSTEKTFSGADLTGLTGLTKFKVSFGGADPPFPVWYAEFRQFTIANQVNNGNVSPLIANLDDVTFQENTVNAAPRQIDPDVTVADSDSADFDGGQVTVSYAAAGLPEDQLTVGNIGSISVSGSAVNYAGVGQIGATSGGSNGSQLVIDLNASATPARVTELLRALAYQNTSNEPASYRTISITVSDGDGGASAAAAARIGVSGQAEAGVESPALTQDLKYPDWVDDLNNGFAITANGSVTLTGDASLIWIDGGGTGPASLTVSAAEQFTGGAFDLTGIVFDLYDTGSTFTVTVIGHRADGGTVTADTTGGSTAAFNAIDLSAMTELTSFDIQIERASGTHGVDYVGLDSFTIANPRAANLPPVFNSAASFSVPETAQADNTVLHDVQANDGDGGGDDANLTYSIAGGDGQSYFSIDSATGEIKLTAAGEASLDYESVTGYTLTVRADDGQTVNNIKEQTITVSVVDVAPAITAGQSFTVSETSADGTSVGAVAITGDEDSVYFSITSGNNGAAFAIDAASGEITVNNAGAIDYEAAASFTLIIQASDGTGSSSQDVTVHLDDVAPAITAGQSFTVSETAADGTSVGAVAITGDDSSIVFSIQAGNGDGVFAINSSTGEISVADSANLDYETTALYTLTIRAADGTTNSDVTVTVRVCAADGSGTMTVAPAVATAGQTSLTLVFTYTAAGGLENGAVSINVPDGWSPPSTNAAGPGYTTASAGMVGVSGRTLTVTGLTLAGNNAIEITYGDKTGGGPGATAASTAGASTWQARSSTTAAGSLADLGISPQVTIGSSNTDPDQSSVAVDENTRPADNAATATVTVILRDAFDNPVSGHTVILDQSAGNSTIEPASAVTDAGGQALFDVKNHRAETVTYRAVDTTPEPDVTVSQTVQVTFEPGVTVNPATGSAIEGGTVQYALALVSQPTADVVISVMPDGQLDVDRNSLTFTGTNYNTPQKVTATAIDNHIVDGDRVGTITHAASSADPAYHGIPVPGFLLDITDNDIPDIIISQSGSPIQITEGGASGAYTMVLATQPADCVTVYVYGGGPVSIDPQVLEFTAGNWNVSQEVAITAVDDDVAEGPHTATVTHTVYSTDPDYNGFIIPDIAADITDNDSPGIGIDQSGGAAVVSEGGGDYTYSMVLTTRPYDDVKLSISGGAQLNVEPGEWTFTAGNWDMPKTIRVWAVDDDITEGDHTGTVSCSVYSADAGYNNYDVSPITVRIIDNDASANANLSGLVLSSGTLAPAFDPATINYNLSVAHSVNSITVTPFPADSNATVTVKGEPVTGGQVSPPISLYVGANSINIVVTAQDGISTKMYTITVNRAAASRNRDSTDRNTQRQGGITSMNIKASTGGKVSLDDVAVEIPAGVLPADATVSIKTLTQDEANRVVPKGLRVKIAGAIYEITTTGKRQFGDNYITIRLAYDPAGIAEGEFPAVHYYDETQGRWIELETQLVQEDDRWYAVTLVNHLTMFAVFSTAAEPEVSITLTVGLTLAGIDGNPYTLDAPPYVDRQSQRTMAPIRFVSEAMGAKVKWNSTIRQVTIEDGGRVIVFTLGSSIVLVDGAVRIMDCAPELLPPGRVFVPLRFIFETLGAEVDYDSATGQITLTRQRQ